MVGIAIRVPHMIESLWFDEIWRTDAVLRNGRLMDLLFHDVHNPLYNLLMYGWTALFGDSELAIRMPSLIFGVLSILLLRVWLARHVGIPEARLAAVLLVLSPVHAWYSGEAKNSMLVLLLSVLTLTAHDRLWSSPGRFRILWAAFCSAMCIYTSWQTLLLLIPLWAILLFNCTRPAEPVLTPELVTRGRRLLISIALALGAALPLLVFKASHIAELAREYVIPLDLTNAARLLFIWYPTGNALVRVRENTFWPYALALGVLVIPPFITGVRTLRRSRPGLLILAGAIGPLLILLAATYGAPLLGLDPPRIYQDRNTLVAMPWLFAIVAVGALRLGPLRIPCVAMLCLLGLASSLAAVTWRADKPTVMNPNPDWRAAAAYIARGETSSRRLTIISTCPLLPFRYYLPSATLIEIPWNVDIAPLIDAHRRAAPAADTYFINNPFWFGHPQDQLKGLESRLAILESRWFRSLQVYRLRPPEAPPAIPGKLLE